MLVSLLAAPHANLLFADASLERGAVVDEQALKVCVQERVVCLDTDSKRWAVGVGADRVHERDQHTVLGDDRGHAARPGCAELRLNGTEESIDFFFLVRNI